ncbi:amidase [Billgrantia aerodenitrificans]|uniref:Amidase n=1 Tax=Billgrantia aerodenitrificans TaxID=2733483 RepID=A0ABS9AR98_9GAMM|nr:amidase [Halomonas aerodenitrificans]MCE8024371.1 amidase [Halomonas aerodenitrificans]
MSTPNNELHYLTVTEQARLIESGQLSPVELLETYLERIERYDDTLRAWITVDREFAMKQAHQAEREIAQGHYRGPLHGLPYGVKDQMHALGLPTTLGTKVLDPEEMKPPHDATIISRLHDAGAVLIGKQNLHEFGKGGTIEFPYGQPRNPWNPAHTASSSSTGSGSATAAGQCSFSIGEDTGGSVRGPASCNGVVGLRPTHGRVSRHGGVMAAYTSDTYGPLTRSVEDCAAVLQAIAGHDPKDPLCIPREVPNFSAQLGRDLKGLKLAVVKEIAWGEATHPEVRAAMLQAIQTLREQGAVVEEISLPLAKWAVPLQLLSADADVGAYFLANYLRDRYQRFDVGTRTRLAAASLIPASVYNRAMRARVLVRRQVLDALRRYDALITPTNVTPPKLIEATQERVDGDQQDVVARLIERRICHYPFSLSNVPALSVPAGFSSEGLPLALQIAGRPFDEATVFRVGHAFQQASAWHRHHPALDTTLKGVA